MVPSCRNSRSPRQPSKKSKYGVPTNGNVNPAYLAAERKEMAAIKKKNIAATEAKRKNLIAKNKFERADYIKKKIGVN